MGLDWFERLGQHKWTRILATAFRDSNNLTTASAEYKRRDMLLRGTMLQMRNGLLEGGLATEYSGSDYTIGASAASDGSVRLDEMGWDCGW